MLVDGSRKPVLSGARAVPVYARFKRSCMDARREQSEKNNPNSQLF